MVHTPKLWTGLAHDMMQWKLVEDVDTKQSRVETYATSAIQHFQTEDEAYILPSCPSISST